MIFKLIKTIQQAKNKNKKKTNDFHTKTSKIAKK